MMKKNLFVTSLFILLYVAVPAQDFEVPGGYTLKVKEDYTHYEKDVIAATSWLQATPLDEQKEKRKEISAFLMDWINGSPTVDVEINPAIMDFEKKNSGMLMLYMATCARYVLENNYSKDRRAKHKYALQAMMGVYKTDKGIKKDKKMEKLIKASDEGKIDEWLEQNLKIN
jgi:hypothetical protein